MSKSNEIISKGRVSHVQEWQLEGLRRLGLSWFAYSQARLTRGHLEAIEHLMKHRHAQNAQKDAIGLVFPVLQVAFEMAMPPGHDYWLSVCDDEEWPLVLTPGLGESGDILIRFRPWLGENGLGLLDAQAGRVDAVGRWGEMEGWTADGELKTRVAFYGVTDVGYAVRRVVSHALARPPFSVLRTMTDEHDAEKIRLCVGESDRCLVSVWRSSNRRWALSSGEEKSTKAQALSSAMIEANRRLMASFEEKLTWL